MTVLEAIKKSADYLAKKGVDSPRLQGELLLAHVLKLPRLQLYLEFERLLATDETDHLRDLVKRRGQLEPLQHVVGSVCFCGLDIAVGPEALIPRPETELLAEAGWTHLLTRFASGAGSQGEPAVLDWGTGTGCLAIALATKATNSRLWALDVSQDAIALARKNLDRHGLGNRITLCGGDGFAALPESLTFDLIVANPPYIATAMIQSLQVEVRDHDPRLALDGGADGLDFYRRLAAESPAWLKPGALLMVEFGDGQELALPKLFSPDSWILEKWIPDYSQRPRILVARRK